VALILGGLLNFWRLVLDFWRLFGLSSGGFLDLGVQIKFVCSPWIRMSCSSSSSASSTIKFANAG